MGDHLVLTSVHIALIQRHCECHQSIRKKQCLLGGHLPMFAYGKIKPQERRGVFSSLFFSRDFFHWSAVGRLQSRSMDNQCGCCSVPVALWPRGMLLFPEGFMKSCHWGGLKPTVFLSFLFSNLLFCSLSKTPSINKYLWSTRAGSNSARGASSFSVFSLWMRSWISRSQMKESRLTDQLWSVQQWGKKKEAVWTMSTLFLPWKWIRSPFSLTYLKGPEWKDISFPNSEARNDLFPLLTECLLAFANQSRNCLMDLALSLSILREREEERQGGRESQTH